MSAAVRLWSWLHLNTEYVLLLFVMNGAVKVIDGGKVSVQVF